MVFEIQRYFSHTLDLLSKKLRNMQAVLFTDSHLLEYECLDPELIPVLDGSQPIGDSQQ